MVYLFIIEFQIWDVQLKSYKSNKANKRTKRWNVNVNVNVIVIVNVIVNGFLVFLPSCPLFGLCCFC